MVVASILCKKLACTASTARPVTSGVCQRLGVVLCECSVSWSSHPWTHVFQYVVRIPMSYHWNQLLSISHSTIPSSIDPNRAMPSRLGPQKLRTWQDSMEDLQSWLPQIAKGCCTDHSDATWCIQYGATFSNHQTSYKTSTWFHTSKSFKTSTTVRPCDILRIDCCSLLMVTVHMVTNWQYHITLPSQSSHPFVCTMQTRCQHQQPHHGNASNLLRPLQYSAPGRKEILNPIFYPIAVP